MDFRSICRPGQRCSVRRSAIRQGMLWAGAGLALGLAAGWSASFALSRVVHGVATTDPLAFIVTPLLLGGSAYVACSFPARRASRLDPLVGLRDQ